MDSSSPGFPSRGCYTTTIHTAESMDMMQAMTLGLVKERRPAVRASEHAVCGCTPGVVFVWLCAPVSAHVLNDGFKFESQSSVLCNPSAGRHDGQHEK